MMNKRDHIIGLVLPNVPAYSETFFNAKIKGLQENGFTVILFSNGKNKIVHQSCQTIFAPDFSIRLRLIVELLIILKNCLFNLESAVLLYKLNRKDRFSIKYSIKNVMINSHFFGHKLAWLHFGFGTMALKSENVAKAIQAKMAVSFRGFDLYIYPVKDPNCYQKLFSKQVKYHVLSNEMIETLVDKGISPKSIFKITPAIDIELFDLKREVKKDPILQILTIGRLHWKKGLEYTLQALSAFNKKNIAFHYTIIGEGVEKEKLIFAAHQLGLTEKVTFAGKVTHQEVKKYLEKSSIYIQYSIQEGFCNAVLEAQAMGLLCIVSDADGLSENVLNEKTGWVIPKRNPELLAQKITEVVNLEEKIVNEIRKNAAERVKNEFNLTNQNAAFKSFYTD